MKILSAVIILALIGGAAWWALDKVDKEPEKNPIQDNITYTIELGDIEDEVTAAGIVEPMISTVVRSEITGRIAEIFVEDGETVSKGQILLELEKTERLTDLEEAERLFEAQDLRLQRAKRDYERLAELRKKNYTNEKEYLDAQTELELNEIELAVRSARLEKARDNLTRTTIRAPHEGSVSNFDLNPGQVITGATSVNEGTNLMTINDLEHLEVKTKVNELDIDQIHIDMPVEITFDALDGATFEGHIKQIFSYAEVENNVRIFRVRVGFDSMGREIRPGITAKVNFLIEKVEDVPVILPSALFEDDEGFIAYRQTPDGNWESVAVETGVSSNDAIEVISGLEVGDVVSTLLPEEIEALQDS